MGIKCVLISSAGIIICRKLTESSLCSSDQTLNWHWTAKSLPPVSAWVTVRRRVFHCSASLASCAELKVSVSKAAVLRSQRDLCLAPCEAACGSTHVTSAVQKKPSLCVHAETLQRPKVTGGHRFGFSKEFKSTSQGQRLIFSTMDTLCLVSESLFMHFGVLKMWKRNKFFNFPLGTKALPERSCFSVLVGIWVLASVIWMCVDEAIHARYYWCNTST